MEYKPSDINIFTDEAGEARPGKVNVYIGAQRGDPDICIYESCFIKNPAEMAAILKIIMQSPLYDGNIFTRNLRSYMIEWSAHNNLYRVFKLLHDKSRMARTRDVDLNMHDKYAKLYKFFASPACRKY